MKYFIILFFIANSLSFAQQFGFVNNATTNGYSYAHAINFNNAGELLTCGFYSGGINYEGTVLPGSGSYNGFLAKYDNEGNIIWVQAGVSTGNGEIHDVAVDSDDNIYISGYFRGTSNFDGLADSSPDEQNAFVAKYDTDGNIIWFERFGSTTRNDAVQIVVDTESSVYVAGYFQGTTEFVSSTLTSTGSADVYLIKLDSDGNEVWLKTGDGVQTATTRGLSIDESDNIYWFGDFRTSINFGGSTLTGNGNNDFFITKISKSGNILLEFSEGTSPYETGTTISTDSDQNIYVVGFIDGTTNFGGIPLTASGVHESVVAKYNSNGVIQWAKNIGASSPDYPSEVLTDSEGNVYVSGRFSGTLTSLNSSIVSSGGADGYISRFDSDGNYEWTLTTSSGSGEQILAMTIDEYNTLYLFGNMSGSVDFSNTTVNAGTSTNAFIASAYVLTPIGVTTGTSVNTSPFTASIYGSVTSEGNSAVTQKGLVWSLSPSPTTSLSTKTTEGAGIGSFSENLTGLLPGTLYYYRAYATNSQGTTYGNELTFFTSAYEIPLDGNQDNFRDDEQDYVHTLLSTNGSNYVTVLSPTSYTVSDVSNYENEIDEEFSYPFGVTEFKINASEAEVKIYYHGIESLDGYVYRKLFPDGTYKEFENVEFSSEIITGNRVAVAILTLSDGGPGDYDGEVNGIIYDPGGPALPISANIPYWDWWWVALFGGLLFFIKKRIN